MKLDLYEIIRKPHVSEKGNALIEDENTYVFEVHPQATKTEIRKAVETLWNVRVRSVRTSIQHGKRRRLGRFVGRSKDWKKAIVRLAEGHAIQALK